MAQSSPLSSSIIAQLEKYSACDISDALLKLKVPGAGYVADLVAYSPQQASHAAASPPVTVAPVSTNIPKDVHWADLAEPGSFAVLKQPEGQTNAVCGGIMALRMKVRQVAGIIVAGRVRDLDELRSTNLPIWGYGTSTVGSGGGCVPWATQVTVRVNGVDISPGDVAFSDPGNGVVIIPRDKVDDVLDLLPGLVAADIKVKEDVARGMPVYEAFKLHRGS
ncbi:RraA-like protein [Trichoderma citrinoviride]|uniref:RraA-like protein n=1 Tax=Trichoderma citrinoviride TaxID=58853 RepID=A0A2T4B5Z3_9HYPO|nr:RraA-like protein [Trichoderma citrinoviride]PTB64621.1 RraA-like protein [Trichoderma citrinoviride]